MGLTFWLHPKGDRALDPRIRYQKQFDAHTLGNHSLVLSMKPKVVIPEKYRYEHSLIMGASGKGKTVLLQNMYAQDMLSGAGVIFVDPKDDQFPFILQCATQANRIPKLHSFRPTARNSETWNPLFGRDPIQIANRLHTALFSDADQANDFYKDVAANMLRNLITLLMAFEKPINLNDVYHAVINIDILRQLVRQLAGNDRYRLEIQEIKTDYLEGRKETAEKFKIGLRVKIQPLVKASWSKLLNDYQPDIIVQDIIEQGDILHFGLASDILGKENYQPLMRLFLAEVKQAAGNRYRQEIAMPCFFYCDEYGDVANNDFIEGIKKYRSAGIGFLIGFQDIGDLTKLGEHFMIQTITNCATKFIFNMPEPISADYVAKLFGTYESDRVSAQSRNTLGEVRGQSERLNDKAFKIEPDYLKNMDRGQCVGLMPFMHKGEYAIFRFKSPMIKKEDFLEPDYEYYGAYHLNLPRDQGVGLNLQSWGQGSGEGQEDPGPAGQSKSANKLKRSTPKNFEFMDGEEDAPTLKSYLEGKS